MLDGRLSLHRTPELELVSLPDPYDPVANASFRISDLSYFEGRYFLYHSHLPALSLFAPVKVVTGRHLSLAVATWFYAVGAWAATLIVIFGFYATLAKRASPLVLVGALLALLFAQGAHVGLRDGTMNQVPISAAWCFGLSGVAALAHAWKARILSPRWVMLGSSLLGLAVVSRPNYVFAAIGLLAGFLLGLARNQRSTLRPLNPIVLAATLPLGGLVVAILLLNVTRFGDPLEFGARYMLGAWDQTGLPALAFSSAGPNLFHYLIGPVDYQLTFPFVSTPSWTSPGLLLHAPFVLLTLVLLLRQRSEGVWAAEFGWIWPAFALGGINFAMLILLPSGNLLAASTSANTRYVLDFQPGLMLAAAVAALSFSHQLARYPMRSRAWTALVGGLAGLSALAGLSFDLSRYPVAQIAPLARALSQPQWLAERLQKTEYGALKIELEFPQGRTGAY